MGPPLLAPGSLAHGRRAGSRSRRCAGSAERADDFATRPPAEARRRQPPTPACRASAAAPRPRCTAATRTSTCSSRRGHWDALTREVVLDRVEHVPELRFFSRRRRRRWARSATSCSPRTPSRAIPVLDVRRRQARTRRGSTASSTRTCPTTAKPGGWSPAAWTRRRARAARSVVRRPQRAGAAARSSPRFADGDLRGGVWDELTAPRRRGGRHARMLAAFYSHPWAWNEIGFGGPAYPRGYARLGIGRRARAWEGGGVRGRPGRATSSSGTASETGRSVSQGRRRARRTTTRAFLLDVAPPRPSPARADARATATRTRSTSSIVGAGAGGATLAQRLARRGWRIVVLERARSGTPTRTGSPTRRARTSSTGRTSASSAATIRSSSARTTPGTASAAR